MAAYAAVLSVTHILMQIQQHPRPPISLHQGQFSSLTHNLTFFQDFLERFSNNSEGDDNLENRIAAAAYAAEDVIQFHIVNQIHAGTNISTVEVCQALERVTGDMDLIKKEVTEMINKEQAGGQDPQMHRNFWFSTVSSWQNNNMVEFDDVFLTDVLDKLSGQKHGLEIIPIVGMGGIGKTTLARSICANPHIVTHFDILAWVTVSQEYSRREILKVIFQEIKRGESNWGQMSEDEIGESVHKELWGRRYLIVVDDMWGIEAWDEVKFFFPDNNNGSRIMVTTRLSNLAFQLSDSQHIKMNFLDCDKSWKLLYKVVFDKELGCPFELENIGKEIARKCRGLPLSIIVIGGLLRISNMTLGYWEHTLENLNSLINLENDEYCLQILNASYKKLPIHIKLCFLYMGVYPEDFEINVSELIKLWVGEGILKPANDKSLEEIAEECLKELIDRNLVLVHELRWNGDPKSCKIHDILRDLCLREAQKQKFVRILNQQDQYLNIPSDINIDRHICSSKDIPLKYSPQILGALESTSPTNSLLLIRGFHEQSTSFSSSRLLKVYFQGRGTKLNFVKFILKQAELQNLAPKVYFDALSRFSSLCSHLWNLQTLKVVNPSRTLIIEPFEIWEMPLLRHAVFCGIQLPDPPHEEGSIVMENLQTLSRVMNFKCSEEVVKRIPNIKTLKLEYRISRLDEEEELPNLCLNNLALLQKLESFNLCIVLAGIDYQEVVQRHLVQNINFPHSLKKLTLRGTMLSWEELTAKVGSLPLLEVLCLCWDACRGPIWDTVEGLFCSLKFLQIDDMFGNLRYWTAETTPFPRLEHLRLQYLEELEEIPLSVGDIPTLKSILLVGCSESATYSARIIEEEQAACGNEDLKILIAPFGADVYLPAFPREVGIVRHHAQLGGAEHDRLELIAEVNSLGIL